MKPQGTGFPSRSPNAFPRGQCHKLLRTYINAVGRGLAPAGAFASGKSTRELPNSDYWLVYDIAPGGAAERSEEAAGRMRNAGRKLPNRANDETCAIVNE